MSDKLITIITVSFNSFNGLHKTIQSVIKNKSKKTEYIIVDGGSTDGTLNLLNKYQNSIEKWVSEPDQGIYDAMNKGILLATGKWILFLGADDLLLADISQLEDSLEEGISYYGNVRLRSTGKIYDGTFNSYKIIQKNICHQAIIYYSDVFINRKFNTKYKIAADYEMNLFLFGSKYTSMKYINNIIADFEDSGISAKQSDFEFRTEFATLCLNFFPLYVFIIYPIARLHYYLGRVPHHLKRLGIY